MIPFSFRYRYPSIDLKNNSRFRASDFESKGSL